MPPNFESPGDTNADNVYEVEVRVNDGTLDATKTITATVTNINDAPVNNIPGAQVTNEDTPLTFSTATGNAIVIGVLRNQWKSTCEGKN